jgi:uncharacterized protein YjdB
MRLLCFAHIAREAALPAVLFTLFLLNGCGAGSSTSGREDRNPLTQILVSPRSPSLNKGQDLQLTATAAYANGKELDVTSSSIWKTNDATVAAIDSDGKLTAVGVGSAQISAVYQDVTGNDSVTVGPPSLLSLTVTPALSSLPSGESAQLIATGTFSDGSTQDLTISVVWTSSQSDIAEVNATGLVTANATGSATISASSSPITGSAQVAVTPAVPVSLAVVPGSVSLIPEGTKQLRAMATFSDGTQQDVTDQALWSSNAPNSVTVGPEGLLSAQQVGTATVSATESDLNGYAQVSVQPLSLVSYFDLTSAQKAQMDGTVRVVNPGLTGGDLCAMIYVFDSTQEMNECCGCRVPDSGLLTLSLRYDLTGNPLTGRKPKTGLIKIVPSDPASNPQCDASSLSANGALAGWESNVVIADGGTPQLVESQSNPVVLPNAEASVLAGECTAIKSLGSGQGVCSCGRQ